MGRGTLVAAAVLGCLTMALATALHASAAEPPAYVKSFGPDGSEATEFARAGSVAVDQQTHYVYVTDRNDGTLLKFDADGTAVAFGGSGSNIVGNEVSGFSFIEAEGDGRNQIAVDSERHIVYVTNNEGTSLAAVQENGEPSLFTAGPGADSSEIGGFTELQGVAIDANGDIYASDHTGTIKVFAPTGELITEFAVSEPSNLAVDGSGNVYVVILREFVLKFSPFEYPVTSTTTYEAAAAPVDSDAPISVAVDPSNNDVYVAQSNFDPKVIVYDAGGAEVDTYAGSGEEGELWSSGGLAIDGKSHRVFLSNNRFTGLQQVEIFAPSLVFVGPPTVVSTSVGDVAADSATLRAEINPNTLQTTYRFEYGLEDCALAVCAATPGSSEVGDGHSSVSVAQTVTGLQSSTTYHYRVVATNAEGTTFGPDRVFTTQASGLNFQLADHRAWEMVSPADKHEGRLVGATWGLIQAAADGNGIAYLSKGSLAEDVEGARSPEAATVLGLRNSQGWRSKDITPPNAVVAPVAAGDRGEYKLFAPDLSSAILTPRSETALSIEASERSPYLRTNTEPPGYRPLVTGRAGYSNVPLGTKFGGLESSAVGAVGIVGASANLSHVVLRSDVPLIQGAAKGALYEWTAGQLAPISVLPISEGEKIVQGDLGAGAESTRHAVSEDGSRVFWTDPASGHLYLRDLGLGESVALDGSPSGDGTPSAVFQGASADGHVAFFTDEQQLTDDSSPEGPDLYRCEISLEAPSSGCSQLTDLSAPLAGSGESADVQGIVAALSDDGGKLYFVAEGALDLASNGRDESADPGKPNLYLWQEGQGLRFVASLSENDSADWGSALGVRGDYGLSITVSPGGRYLTFMSERSLTGYDNRDESSGEVVQEAFRYDAVTEQLDCLSCAPTGARPNGDELDSSIRLIDPRGVWTNRRVAATLPEATASTITGPSLYRPRATLDNGRVFFNAVDSLVAADSNRQWDVYQYEPAGTGDCTISSSGSGVALTAGGCVSLMSSGTAEREAAFMDASTSGNDVFFLTPGRLSVEDKDQELDLYDARVDGTSAAITPSTECVGGGCQSVGSAPAASTPASTTFEGRGNVHVKPRRRCPKGKRAVRRKGRVHCVARKHRRGGRHHHGKANKNRRADR